MDFTPRRKEVTQSRDFAELSGLAWNIQAIFVYLSLIDERKEIFSKIVQLGTLAFLFAICSDWPGMVLVLSPFRVVLVFQFVESHHNLRWF